MLGEADPHEMRDRMDAKRPGLFDEWFDFWQVEPFGPETVNLMLARIANAVGGGGEESYLPGVVDG